jgi:hypothetical protein
MKKILIKKSNFYYLISINILHNYYFKLFNNERHTNQYGKKFLLVHFFWRHFDIKNLRYLLVRISRKGYFNRSSWQVEV